ncbi:MAG: YihY/virulence factor BrkB family protein [Deltaproteobacteria bacterium]|nr:YihY/virulence factor BrkB family protein [Deltaproteobacteria bacterium]
MAEPPAPATPPEPPAPPPAPAPRVSPWARLVAHAELWRDALHAFVADDGTVYAAGIAFYALVSMVPLAAVLLAIGGSVLAGAGAGDASMALMDDVIDALRYLVPIAPEQDLRAVLTSLVARRGDIGLLGTVGLLIAASQVVNAIRRAVARPFGIVLGETPGVPHPSLWERGARAVIELVLGRFKTLFWISALGFGAGGLRVVTATVASVIHLRPPHVVTHLLQHPFVAGTLSQVGGFIFTFVAYNLILIHVARRQSTWAARALGGIWFALLQALAEWVYRTYLEHYARLSAQYGSVATLVAVALWTFYFSCVFMIAVELTAVASRRTVNAPT